MTGKKIRPVIGKLITSGGVTEAGTSPRSPLEFKILSPRGIVKCDMGGVGLGIVAALEKSGDSILVKKATFSCRNSIRSDPIPVNHARNVGVFNVHQENENETGSSEEEYTIVTCHRPNKSFTKVYHGGCVYEGHVTKNGGEGCLFDISPAKPGGDTVYPASDFLSSCSLCKKKLHGKDIYMYRGEKAFCSTVCRYRQIVMDERGEKHCSSQASRSVSSSPCSHGQNQMFSTGIFAI